MLFAHSLLTLCALASATHSATQGAAASEGGNPPPRGPDLVTITFDHREPLGFTHYNCADNRLAAADELIIRVYNDEDNGDQAFLAGVKMGWGIVRINGKSVQDLPEDNFDGAFARAKRDGPMVIQFDRNPLTALKPDLLWQGDGVYSDKLVVHSQIPGSLQNAPGGIYKIHGSWLGHPVWVKEGKKDNDAFLSGKGFIRWNAHYNDWCFDSEIRDTRACHARPYRPAGSNAGPHPTEGARYWLAATGYGSDQRKVICAMTVEPLDQTIPHCIRVAGVTRFTAAEYHSDDHHDVNGLYYRIGLHPPGHTTKYGYANARPLYHRAGRTPAHQAALRDRPAWIRWHPETGKWRIDSRELKNGTICDASTKADVLHPAMHGGKLCWWKVYHKPDFCKPGDAASFCHHAGISVTAADTEAPPTTQNSAGGARDPGIPVTHRTSTTSSSSGKRPRADPDYTETVQVKPERDGETATDLSMTQAKRPRVQVKQEKAEAPVEQSFSATVWSSAEENVREKPEGQVKTESSSRTNQSAVPSPATTTNAPTLDTLWAQLGGQTETGASNHTGSATEAQGRTPTVAATSAGSTSALTATPAAPARAFSYGGCDTSSDSGEDIEIINKK